MTSPAPDLAPHARLIRLFPAPPAAVFRALTAPEEVRCWWGPNATAEADLHAGGRYRWAMTFPDGQRYCSTGAYQEITPSEWLRFSFAWEGAEEQETLVSIELQGLGEGTEAVLVHTGFPDQQAADNHAQGWSDCLDRLFDLLQNRPESA